MNTNLLNEAVDFVYDGLKRTEDVVFLRELDTIRCLTPILVQLVFQMKYPL